MPPPTPNFYHLVSNSMFVENMIVNSMSVATIIKVLQTYQILKNDAKKICEHQKYVYLQLIYVPHSNLSTLSQLYDGKELMQHMLLTHNPQPIH